ncbi:TPA: excinuclease ABC subunit A, partial [Enterococcus faecium]|nr:excinuclease ABC subunit A [Enterococcus faecium]
MWANQNPVFVYEKEPSRDILCIDCKSFYASVECVEKDLDPLTTKLVVMSYPSDSTETRGSGLILASSPAAKKAYGITNISRARDLPFPYP